MARQIIDIGVQGNDGTGDSIRDSFRKVNDNFNEIYAVFGVSGTIGFTTLNDAPETYGPDQVIMGDTTGTNLSARTLVGGAGIEIDTTSNGQVVFNSSVTGLTNDPSPVLGAPLNVRNFAIGNVPNPTQSVVDEFNNYYVSQGFTTTLEKLAINKGYADSHYVVLTDEGIVGAIVGETVLPGPLKTRPEPTVPELDNPEYDPTLSSNYLSTEALQRKDTVYRGGDTMTGPLTLSDHPAPLEGYGTPNGAGDLQAATKFYVDNNTYTSNVNLYVTTGGDDLQQKAPVGKEGRFWQYAYRTVGAAALQAENLINLANQEPGPYRQRLAYTIGPDQTFSTIQSVTRTGGFTGDQGYEDAYTLLRNNKEFIQAETIAYISNKYVNAFSYLPAKCSRDVGYILDAVGYDLVLGTTYNSYTAAARYFNATSNKVLASQLVQTIDAINFARDQILNYTYSSDNLSAYIDDVVDALGYDLVFQSNYQSIQIALAFESAGTDISTAQIVEILADLKTQMLADLPTPLSSTAVALITDNIALISDLITTGEIPTLVLPELTTTTTGQLSANFLLLNNIAFMQSEIVSFLSAEYPNLAYSKTTCKRDVKFIVWSLVYDLMYGGNQQSIYAGKRYWTGAARNIADGEVTATIAAVGYINTLAQAVINNASPEVVYQQSVKQYRNDTYVDGGDVGVGIASNVDDIQYIITYGLEDGGHPVPNIVNPTVSAGSSTLQTARTYLLLNKNDYKSNAITYVEGDGLTPGNFPVVNDPAIIATITELFAIITNTLQFGIETLENPTFTNPVPDSAVEHAVEAILANLDFIADDTVAWVTDNNPSFTYNGNPAGAEKCRRDVVYIIQSLCYDLTYGCNAATVSAAGQYWTGAVGDVNSESLIPGEELITDNAYGHVNLITRLIADNQPVTPQPSNSTTQTFTGTSDGDATSSTINILFDDIRLIISGEPVASVAPSLVGYATELTDVRDIIVANTATIAANTITFLDTTYKGGFNYDEAVCSRDVGYIIEAMSIDLITGGTWQTVNAGKSYYKNASAKSIAIGTQYTETVDGITFAKELALQVMNQTTATRYQSLVDQVLDGGLEADPAAVDTVATNMDTVLNIINYGYGVAPTPSFGTGIWEVVIDNGNNGWVDQGSPTNNDIIPAKVIVGVGSDTVAASNAYASIVTYEPGDTLPTDTIRVRLTKPGLFTVGEQLEFGETVRDLNITIFVESGIYYEDYPIRLPANCSIKGDEFRRTIIRPRDRISQSPWRKIFFYRDAIIDAMELGIVDSSGTDYASETTANLGGTDNNIVVTLGEGQSPSSWIGKVLEVRYVDQGSPVVGEDRVGKAVVDSVSGNFMNCSVIYPFYAAGVVNQGDWHLYGTKNYGRHYLTNPLDVTSLAKNNKEIDVFLCNDAVRISNMTFQGHGGFAMVLDPEGQVKTKSPYGQVCSSFSQSNNRKRFAGGQFVDGFAGRLTGTITNIADNGITVTVVGETNSGLDIRPPQPPCAFYVQGYRYQIDDVVSHDANTATVVLTLNTATPYLYDINGDLVYNSSKCSRDVGLILDAVGYDTVLGSNYQSVKAGLSYLRSYSSVVTSAQKEQTIAGINFARDLALAEIPGGTYAAARAALTDRMEIITTIIDQGLNGAPAITYPSPVGVDPNVEHARDLIVANKDFIKAEITAWIADEYIVRNIPNYNAVTCARDVGYVVDALVYDLVYDDNSQIKDVAEAYYRSTTSYIPTEEVYTTAAFGHLKTILGYVVLKNTSWSPASGNTETQYTTGTAATSAEVTTLEGLCDILIDYVLDGDYDSVVATTTPDLSAQDANLRAARLAIDSAKTTIQDDTIVYLNNGGGLRINIEMGGNKSMLANDFAMINDLGYAIVTTNGAVSEQVSTFTYYCHTHYWANNGGQIRSVAGSNAHGNYGLRATGYDVTEKPDAVTLANDMVQVARVYKQGSVATEMTPTLTKPALAVWITGYDYNPMATSELEIDHTLDGKSITRYEVNSVEHTTITINGVNVLKLNLATAGNNGTSTSGLASELYDGQLVTIRTLQNVKFNDISNVNPTRPSTALQYTDNLAEIYRIIAYNLTDSTGELLPSNIAVLQSDSSFAYYKFVTDIGKMTEVDIDDPTKTQGSQLGDTKIAVLEISKQTTIDQINKGTYLTGWNGRVHRVIGYTVPEFLATAQYVSGGTSTTIIIEGVAGTIEDGDILTSVGVGSSGFDGSQYVISSSYNALTERTSIVLNTGALTIPVGTITFGIERNGWLEIDANPVYNISADGTGLNAMTFNSKVTGEGTTEFVTFDIPYAEVQPAVDSYITIAGNSNSSYNGSYQITGLVNQTTITVADTTGLVEGMVVTSLTPGVTLPESCIIQSVVDNFSFIVSPAVWIPASTEISCTVVKTVDRIEITDGGSGYTEPPLLTISGGGPLTDAIATCTVTEAGEIDSVTLVSPGYGYVGTPTVIIEGSNQSATLTAIMTAPSTEIATALAGTNLITLTVAYPTDPGVAGTGTPVTISSFATKTGTGPYSITFNIPSTAVTQNAYYKVAGNGNPLYNGFYKCTTATGTVTSVTLEYPNDPGTYGSGTTTLTKETTNATSNSLGISKPFSLSDSTTLRLGYPAGTSAQITTRISTCRATGHDFLDIGTGSYSTTNYPYQIYGNPAQSRAPSQEVQEDGVGRVFYVTTDQNGIFRVGRFFTVDQGTGTVTFSASIALSNLDGLGFKRGVVVSEFSTDASMANNGPDIVPVQSAVRGYIDKRLGLDHGGGPVASNNLIGPGFLALNGSLAMKGNLNMASFTIGNVKTPTSNFDAANKIYVDTVAAAQDQFSELNDVTFTSLTGGDFAVYDGTDLEWKNATLPTGDVNITYDHLTQSLTTAIQNGKIVNLMVSGTAGIEQSKLAMTKASTRANATGITQADLGLASFKSTEFNATNGWIELKDSTSVSTGIVFAKLQHLTQGTVIGRGRTDGTGVSKEISFGDVIAGGDGIKNASFSYAPGGTPTALSGGAMLVTYDGANTANNTYSTVPVTSAGGTGNSSLVKTGSAGEVDAKQYKIDGYKVIDTSSTTLSFTTPGGWDYMSAIGSTLSNTTVTVNGTLDVTPGTLKVDEITTGAAGTNGTLTGAWQLTSSSSIDFTNGTLKSTSLSTGAEGTDGSIVGRWTLTGASRMQATYADLAEFYEGDQEYAPGTVLVFGGDKEVTTTNAINDTRLAGVVSTDPAYLMNNDQTGIKVMIALAGRVPCKVVGRVKKGDMLTTSATPGCAVKANDPKLGAIIGKALEDKDYGEAGVIEVAVGRA